MAILWVNASASGGGDGSADHPFDTIQAAIDAASPGTVIMVAGGLYEENLEFSTSGTEGNPISLISADGPGAAVIMPEFSDEDTIQIDGTDHIVIDGFELHGSDDDTRQVIHIHAVDDNTDPASHITISNNTIIRGEGDGIKVSKSTDITLDGNTIVGGGSEESGIDVVGGQRVVIQGNTLTDNGYVGIMVKGGSSDVIIADNQITGSGHNAIEVGGYTNLDSYPPGFLEAGHTYEAKNVLVQGNTITESGNSALRVIGADNVVVTENTFTGAGSRIKIDDSAKFHDPWYSENIALVGNEFDNDDWLRDRSALSDIHTDPDAIDFFVPWLSEDVPDEVEDEPVSEPEPEPEPDPEPEPAPGDDDQDVEFDTVLEGTSDEDELSGTSGNDFLDGLEDDDRLSGRDGDDLLDGGAGRDRLEGGDGNDTLYGGSGDDDLRGESDDDLLFGMEGRDELEGGNGNDTLDGGAEDDELEGGKGSDVLRGGTGDDRLDGDEGNDVLEGGSGDDELRGGKGDDVLDGGGGDDRLEGGDGDDTFVFRFETGIGEDEVKDFERGEDMLVFEGFGEALDAFSDLDTNGNGTLDDGDAMITVSSNKTYISLDQIMGSPDGTNEIQIDSYQLTADDFAFVF